MADPVVFDVDGTICFDGRTIGSDIVDALLELRRRTRLIFASARPIRDLLPVLPEPFRDDTLVGGNGAFCRVDGETTVLSIDDESRRLIDELVASNELGYLVDGEWDYAYTGAESHRIFRQLDAGGLAHNVPVAQIEQYSKVVLFTADPAVIAAVERLPLSVNVHPDEAVVDIAPSGITKHHALSRIGVRDGGYVAFGNDANDELMLRHARTSYCVGAHPALSFADVHVAPDDVASAIGSVRTSERLFHLVQPAVWDAAVAAGQYAPPSLETEGFVHFSFAEQVSGTANLLYRELPELVVVEVDAGRLGVEVRVEDSYGSGTEFPHAYGPVPTSAAVAVHPIVRATDGDWEFSPGA